MNTSIVKASKAIKASTSVVRAHLDAVERARELYQAAMKRAEAEYFDRIKRATAIITGEESETQTEPSATSETTAAA